MSEKEVILTINETDDGVTTIAGDFPILQRELDGYYFVHCPFFHALGASNKSYEDARKDLGVDLDLFFKVHLERGTLKSALHSLNWNKVNETSYNPPRIPSYLLERSEILSLSHTY